MYEHLKYRTVGELHESNFLTLPGMTVVFRVTQMSGKEQNMEGAPASIVFERELLDSSKMKPSSNVAFDLQVGVQFPC